MEIRPIVLAAGLALVMPAAGAGAQTYPAPEKLLETTADTVGTPIRYPEGTPRVSSYILTMVPGHATGWHRHEVPLYARVLDGVLTVDYGDKGTRIYRAGDTFMEAMGIAHNGRVVGDAPARLLIVFMGSDAAENTMVGK